MVSRLIERYTREFFGYGNLRAPYWYLGLEEGGGHIEERLRVWNDRGCRPIEDLREFHLAAEMGPQVRRFFQEPVRVQTTWKQIVRTTLVAEGRSCTDREVREYQATQLGRLDGETALLELFPLPAPSTKDWPYSEYHEVSWLRDRKTYSEEIGPGRIERIRQLMDEHQPRRVVMYGIEHRWAWVSILGSAFVPADLVECAKRGATDAILIKHPATIGVTNFYFEEVGRFLAQRHIDASLQA